MRGLTWAWQNGAWTIATQTPVVTDRLGSVRAYQTNGTWTTLSYYPFGEEKTPVTPDGAEKFGTYIRDSTTPAAKTTRCNATTRRTWAGSTRRTPAG